MSDIDMFHARHVRNAGFSHPTLHRRLGFAFAIFFAFLGAALFLGKVNVVASAETKLIAVGNTQAIQPSFDARVLEMPIRPLQRVKAGDTLFVLDTGAIVAEIDKLSATEKELDQSLKRLALLRSKFQEAQEHPLSTNFVSNPFEKTPLAMDYLLISSYHSLRDKLLSLRKRHEALSQQIGGYHSREKQLRLVIDSAERRLDTLRKMADIGHFPKFELMKEEESLARLHGDNIELKSKWGEAGSQLDSLVLEVRGAASEALQKIDQNIADTRLKLSQTRTSLVKLDGDLKHGSIVSPIDGVIQDITVSGPGAIVRGGDVIARAVPEFGSIEAEALIENKDVGFVYAGQAAVLKFDTYPFEKYGTVPGTVSHVATDSTFVQGRGWHYKMLVRLERDSMTIDGKNVALKIGETGRTDVILRKRRLIDFFAEPVFRYTKEVFETR